MATHVTVKIKPSELFTLTINGLKYDGFRKASQWEGFTKYDREKDFVIVATGDDKWANLVAMSSVFQPEELAVVSMSKGLFNDVSATIEGRNPFVASEDKSIVESITKTFREGPISKE